MSYYINSDMNFNQKLHQYVNDFSGVFSSDKQKELNEIFARHENTTTEQVVTVIFPSREWRELIDIAKEIFETNTIGQKDLNNWLLLVIASDEKKIRIMTGKGMELKYTEMKCHDIIENHLRPLLNNSKIEELVRKWGDIVQWKNIVLNAYDTNETLWGIAENWLKNLEKYKVTNIITDPSKNYFRVSNANIEAHRKLWENKKNFKPNKSNTFTNNEKILITVKLILFIAIFYLFTKNLLILSLHNFEWIEFLFFVISFIILILVFFIVNIEIFNRFNKIRKIFLSIICVCTVIFSSILWLTKIDCELAHNPNYVNCTRNIFGYNISFINKIPIYSDSDSSSSSTYSSSSSDDDHSSSDDDSYDNFSSSFDWGGGSSNGGGWGD